MTKAEINKMNAAECFKKISFIEMNAKLSGKEISKANQKLIKMLDERIDAVNPDRED